MKTRSWLSISEAVSQGMGGRDGEQDAPTSASRPKSEPNYSLGLSFLVWQKRKSSFFRGYEMNCCCLQYASHKVLGHQDCWKFFHQSVVPPVKWGYSLPHKSSWLKTRGHKLLDIYFGPLHSCCPTSQSSHSILEVSKKINKSGDDP